MLTEVADLIEAAGERVNKGKPSSNSVTPSRSWRMNARPRAFGAPELKARRVESTRSAGKWPDPDPALIESVRREFADHTLAHWQKISRAVLGSQGDVLPKLFPPKALISFGPRKDVHWVRVMDVMLLNELAPAAQFIVPNPIRKASPFHLEDNRRSVTENFPLRRFLIVEFDRKKIAPPGSSQSGTLGYEPSMRTWPSDGKHLLSWCSLETNRFTDGIRTKGVDDLA